MNFIFQPTPVITFQQEIIPMKIAQSSTHVSGKTAALFIHAQLEQPMTQFVDSVTLLATFPLITYSVTLLHSLCHK